MSCPGDVCGHHGLSALPAMDPQANVSQGAALDARERTARMTHVLVGGAPVTGLPRRVVVPAHLRRVQAEAAVTDRS